MIKNYKYLELRIKNIKIFNKNKLMKTNRI